MLISLYDVSLIPAHASKLVSILYILYLVLICISDIFFVSSCIYLIVILCNLSCNEHPPNLVDPIAQS
jgi:hypothetical protein